MKKMKGVLALVLPLAIVACSSETKPAETASAPAAEATPAAAPQPPRVFFVDPADGATVKSPVHLRFGAENIAIMPVPAGDVTAARPGMGHHHLGVDQDCLAPGTNIVKGTPQWVHFGDGTTEMDLQLTPGMHKLSLQIGDDMHNTMANLCQTITINVMP
jgi:hypothetical protein